MCGVVIASDNDRAVICFSSEFIGAISRFKGVRLPDVDVLEKERRGMRVLEFKCAGKRLEGRTGEVAEGLKPFRRRSGRTGDRLTCAAGEAAEDTGDENWRLRETGWSRTGEVCARPRRL